MIIFNKMRDLSSQTPQNPLHESRALEETSIAMPPQDPHSLEDRVYQHQVVCLIQIFRNKGPNPRNGEKTNLYLGLYHFPTPIPLSPPCTPPPP